MILQELKLLYWDNNVVIFLENKRDLYYTSHTIRYIYIFDFSICFNFVLSGLAVKGFYLVFCSETRHWGLTDAGS